MDGGVFINYRGEDSQGYGPLLRDRLAQHFGEQLVFLSSESIPPGADFTTELIRQVRSARVLLAVIGSHWLTVADPSGRRRIDAPDDWVRRELAEAFAAGVTVIPLLLDHADLPSETDLPTDIAALSRRQYLRLRRREARTDLDRLVTELAALEPTFAAAARRPVVKRRKSARALIAPALVVVSLLIGGAVFVIIELPAWTAGNATLDYKVSCSSVNVSGDWPYYSGAGGNQLDVQVDGIVIGDAIVTTADRYDGQIHSDAARPCRWPDLNNKTATVDLSPGTGQHQISVWLLCRDRPPCPSASESVTFTR